MIALIIGGIVAAIASVVGAGIAAHSAKKNTELQNQYNQQLWQQTNDYNNPINQMARLEQAGINRNLVASNANNVAMSTPQAGVPDYSDAISRAFGGIGSAANSIGKGFYDAEQAELNRDIQRSNLELNKQKLDNAIQQTEIKRTLANLALRKGDLQMAAMALENNFQALTFMDRLRQQQWETLITGNKYAVTSEEALRAPDYYRLRNDRMVNDIWESRQRVAQGWDQLNYQRQALAQQDRHWMNDFAWNKEMDKQKLQNDIERIGILEGQLRVARDAEERKQIEQQLRYLYKSVETALQFTVPIPK